ncbi:MAG: protein phosphatase 2C domain-containing protein [Wenzhouxiangellaceae bacterium]|nr:protein phosphatase 2C domain-containing protein [Wenzhouxiangellaceae bacterium]
MRFHARTDAGKRRPNNQDHLLICAELSLWAVADGMGGHAGGALASQIACRALEQAVRAGGDLNDGFQRAHEAVCGHQLDSPELDGMGTTLVAVRGSGQALELGWVGDSRLYRLRDGVLDCLTRDQNVPQMLLAAGWIDEDEVEHHPRQHVLTDCIGQRGDDGPTIEIRSLDLAAGDRLLLCSDGLSRELDNDRIRQLMAPPASPEQACDALLLAALDAGGRDNVSVIVLDPAGAPETD